MTQNENGTTESTDEELLTLSPTEADAKLHPHPVYEEIYDDTPRSGMLEDVAENGVRTTIHVVSQTTHDVNLSDDEYLIISGHLRTQAAIEMGCDIEAYIKPPYVSKTAETQAVVLCNQDGRATNDLTAIKEADVLYSVFDKTSGTTNERVAQRLDTRDASAEWVRQGLYIWNYRPKGKKSDEVSDGINERAERLLGVIEDGEKAVGTAYDELKDDVDDGRYSENPDGNVDSSGESNSDSDDEEDDEGEDDEGEDDKRESGTFGNTDLSTRTLLPEGEVRKTPVVGTEITYAAQEYWVGNQGAQTDDKPLDWWTDEGIVDPHHPYVLVNPVTTSVRNGIQQKDPLWKVLRLDRDEHFVIADSGGYQLQSRDDVSAVESGSLTNLQNRISPDGVLRWQLKNADAGMIIDVAPSTVDAETYTAAFDQALAETTQYAETALAELRIVQPDPDWRIQNPGAFNLYGVIHGKPDALPGKPYKPYQRWYDALTTEMTFDGWAFGELDGLSDIALCLAFAGEYIDADRIHLLGAKGLQQRVLMRHFTELYPDTIVTHDTSRGSIWGAQQRQFKSPIRHGFTNAIGSGENHTAYETMPCGCSVCERVEADVGAGEVAEKGGSIFGSIATLHNHQIQQQRLRDVDGHIEVNGRGVLDGFAGNDVSTVAGTRDRKLSHLELEGDFWALLETDVRTRGELCELYYALRFLTEVYDDGLDTACKRWSFSPELTRTELRQSVVSRSESTIANPFAEGDD